MHHQKNNLPAIKNVIVCNYCYKFIGQVSDIVAGIKSVKITSVRMNFLRIGEQKKGKNSKLKYSLAANAAVSNKDFQCYSIDRLELQENFLFFSLSLSHSTYLFLSFLLRSLYFSVSVVLPFFRRFSPSVFSLWTNFNTEMCLTKI